MSKYPAYVALAHDLSSDDAEWTIYTGVNAEEQARYRARQWAARPGNWVAQVYELANDRGVVVTP